MIKKSRLSVDGEPLWNRYFHSKGASLGIPTAGSFELTNRCNFSCKMCYVHGTDCADALSAKDWIKLGEQAAQRGTVFLLLTGGEPLLRPDFREIYTAVRRMGIMVSVNTNGYLVDDSMVDFFASYPPMRLNISLYGTSNGEYASLCGVPAFDRVLDNIRKLKAAGIMVKLNASVTPYNCDDIPGLYKTAEELGVPLKATSYMFPPVRVNGCKFGDAPHRFTAEEAARIMLLCREQHMTPEQLASSCVEAADDDCTDGTGSPMRCRAGKTSFWITHDGRMLPCGMFPWDGVRIADVGFDAAWQSVREACDALRMPAKCSGCAYNDRCTACAASCITETGSTETVPEYICTMTKTLEGLTAEKYGKK